ncbi:MAG: hypothetical protein KA419_17445 [Acidobacteria bacterium]|nr:hypothetical protein [Acidobacteriota bacterium]
MNRLSFIPCFLLTVVVAAGVATAAPPPNEVRLRGTLGTKSEFHMALQRDGDRVTGTYFYVKYKSPIPVRGTWSGPVLKLEETGADGKVAGRFEGRVDAAGRVEGTWTRADGAKSFPFRAEPLGIGNVGSPWNGDWTRTAGGEWESADLKITVTSDNAFSFELMAFSGSHSGEASGGARIEGRKAVWTEAETGCRMVFTLEGDTIRLEASDACSSLAGMGVVFDGTYRKGKIKAAPASLLSRGVFETESQDAAFRALVGKHYDRFAACFHLVGEEEDLDGFGARVRRGFVRGIAPSMNAIVMIDPNNRIWAAVVDDEAEAVRYFTSVAGSKQELPKTIRAWLQSSAYPKIIRQ